MNCPPEKRKSDGGSNNRGRGNKAKFLLLGKATYRPVLQWFSACAHDAEFLKTGRKDGVVFINFGGARSQNFVPGTSEVASAECQRIEHLFQPALAATVGVA